MSRKSSKKTKVSFVLPCLNEAKNLRLLIPKIVHYLGRKYDYEIICVDDGSTDDTQLFLNSLGKRNRRIKAIYLYKRFGHQEALRTGISYSSGKCVVVMDADFQHPPRLIPKLMEKWEKGNDLVQGQKKDDATAGRVRKIQRKIGYFLWGKFSKGILAPRTSDFYLISRQIADFIKESNESMIFLRGIVRSVAKNPSFISYSVAKRKYGKSSYTTKMFINMFLNGFVTFSPKPLRTAAAFGLFSFGLASIFLTIDILRAFISGEKIIQGWTTIILLMIIFNGFIILYLGILGEYIGIIFNETKGRPRNIIASTLNIRKQNQYL